MKTTIAGLIAAIAYAWAALPQGISWQKALTALALAAIGFFARDDHK